MPILDFKAKSKQPFAIRMAADKQSAEIVLYQAIGESFWGDTVSAKQFSDELKAIGNVKNLTVRINSPGGDVFDGVAIYNRLKQHPAEITVYIDGLAASIASIIALAGDKIIMGDGALFMVHLPWTYAIGNRNDLENTVNRLMDVEEQLISIYQKKSGLDRNEIRAMLEAETWMGADEAIEKGFVTEKAEESLPIAASVMEQRWIRNAPKAFKSEKSAIDNAKESLKKKISETIARK